MRIRWSEHEARAVLSAWRKSGQTIERFAKNRGIVPQRIRNWIKKLDPSNAAGELSLVPVEVKGPKRGEPVAIYLRSGHVVRVGRGFDEEAFARVVALLEGRSGRRAATERDDLLRDSARRHAQWHRTISSSATSTRGASIAALYTIIATCEARGVNPFAYFADVIPLVQYHPADRLDELLPASWTPQTD